MSPIDQCQINMIFNPELISRHQPYLNLLEAAVFKHKLAPSYLLSGQAIEDKWQVARELAAHLNCSSSDNLLPGSCLRQKNAQEKSSWCNNCRWITNNEHAQAMLVLGTESSKAGKVPVEKARQLVAELEKTSSFYRVIVIPEAGQDSFHRPSASALLKTMEEPGGSCVFLLFAVDIETVLPTIVSRCQLLVLSSNCTALPRTTLTAHQQDKLADSLFLTPLPLLLSSLDSSLSLARTLEEASGLEEAPGIDLDLLNILIAQLVSYEFSRLRDTATRAPEISLYLRTLLELVDSTRDQLEQYVQPKASLESFVLSARQLIMEYQ